MPEQLALLNKYILTNYIKNDIIDKRKEGVNMKISIASDHGGFLLKEEIKSFLVEKGFTVKDNGTHCSQSCDYPDFAKETVKDVLNGYDFGVLVCTTGIGMSIYANKYKGIRAALVTNLDASVMTRLHNDSNVICLGAKYTNCQDAKEYTLKFIETKFSNEEKHQRRIDKIKGVNNE